MMLVCVFRDHSIAAGLAGLLSLTIASGCSSDEGGNEGTGAAGGQGGGSAGTGGTPATSASDWTLLGYDAKSTYNNTAETKISRSSVARLAEKWTKDLGNNIYSAPLQVGGRIYTSGNGTFCLDAATGQVIWENLEVSTTAAMAYEDGVLYLNDAEAVLLALDANDGKQLWEFPTSEQVGASGFSSPIIAGDLVIVGGATFQEVAEEKPTFRGSVTAVNKNTHQLAWRSYTVPEGSTGASLWSSVSYDLASNRVFAATGNNYTEPGTDTSDAFLALNHGTGAIEWKSQRYAGDIWSFFAAALGNPDADFGANPVLFEAEVDGVMTELVGGGQKSGDAHVVRRADGTEVWKRKLGPGNAAGSAGIFNNSTWDGKHLLIADNGATSDAPGSEPMDPEAGATAVLFALDPATGDIVWERQLPGQVMAPITVANGVGFVGADKTLEAFDTDTGEVLFSHKVAATIACPATISNGRVAFGSGLTWFFGTPGSILTVLELPQ